MIAFSIALLFGTATVLSLAVIARSLRLAIRAYAETSAALAACERYRDVMVRMEELQVRLALPRSRPAAVSPAPLARRPLPQRRLLRAVA